MLYNTIDIVDHDVSAETLKYPYGIHKKVSPSKCLSDIYKMILTLTSLHWNLNTSD